MKCDKNKNDDDDDDDYIPLVTRIALICSFLKGLR